MRVHKVVISLLLTMAVHSANADGIFYSFERAMKSPDVEDILDPEVKLFFGTQETPPLAEKSRPDSHSRSGMSIAPFGRNPDVLCGEGFTENLAALIRNAKKMGFDTIFNIRGKMANGSFSNKGFDCSAGRRTAEVRLEIEYGLTQDGARLAEQRAGSQTASRQRKPPSKNAIFLPLDEVMNSPEAKAVLGPIKAHWGANKLPAYSERYGPEEYDGEGSVKELGREGACKKAVLEALKAALEDVAEQGYNGMIRIHSYLDEQLAPNDTDFECEAGSRWAAVNLQVTLANVK
jgi:hypothetical protein